MSDRSSRPFGTRLWGQPFLEPMAEQTILSLLFWGSEMFSCVRSLWSTARNGGRKAQIPNERVFAEWVLLARTGAEISGSSQAKLFFWDFHPKPAWGKIFFLSAFLKQILTMNSAQVDGEGYKPIHPNTLRLPPLCKSKRFLYKYTSTREIRFAASLFIPRRT